MAKNGYFDKELLVAVPYRLTSDLEHIYPNSIEFRHYISSDSTDLIVFEGNRGLATAKLLVNPELREKLRINHLPSLSEQVADGLTII